MDNETSHRYVSVVILLQQYLQSVISERGRLYNNKRNKCDFNVLATHFPPDTGINMTIAGVIFPLYVKTYEQAMAPFLLTVCACFHCQYRNTHKQHLKLKKVKQSRYRPGVAQRVLGS